MTLIPHQGARRAHGHTGAVPVSTLTNSAPWNSRIYIRPHASNCPNPEDTVGITTGTGATATDIGFNFIVP